jgi:glycosyltransferase involved in cell wall biosynthesis
MLNAHVYPSTLEHESRMLRITRALAASGQFSAIEMVGIGEDDLPERHSLDMHRQVVRLPLSWGKKGKSNWSKVFRLFEWSLRLCLYFRHRPVACLNAHSLTALPACAVISHRHNALLIYDPHELETESTNSLGIRKVLAKVVERLLVHHCDAVFVVSDSIADWYQLRYGIPRPTVIRNFSESFTTPSPDRVELRSRLCLRSDAVTFIYQGGIMHGRGVEKLLRLFARLPQHDLLLLGDGPLTSLIQSAATKFPNIRHHPAVDPEVLLDYTRCADVGLCLTEPVCLSYAYSLPNKLFEYLAAGLPIVVSDLPEQAQFVSARSCGWIAPSDDQSLLELLASITHQTLAKPRLAALEAASECNWSNEAARMLDVYRTLTHV